MVAWWFGQQGYSLHWIFVLTSVLWLAGFITIYFTFVDVFHPHHQISNGIVNGDGGKEKDEGIKEEMSSGDSTPSHSEEVSA